VHENNGTWIEFNKDGYIYDSNGGKSNKPYTVTDEEVNGYPYQCDRKNLKLPYTFSIENDNIFNDNNLDYSFIEYNR
jgi:hypothetical protein